MPRLHTHRLVGVEMGLATLLVACGHELPIAHVSTDAALQGPMSEAGALNAAWMVLLDRAMGLADRRRSLVDLMLRSPDAVAADMALYVCSPAVGGPEAGLKDVLQMVEARPLLKERSDMGYVIDHMFRMCDMIEHRELTGWQLSLDWPDPVMIFYYLEDTWIKRGKLSGKEAARCAEIRDGLMAGAIWDVTDSGVRFKALMSVLPVRRLCGPMHMMLGNDGRTTAEYVRALVGEGK